MLTTLAMLTILTTLTMLAVLTILTVQLKHGGLTKEQVHQKLLDNASRNFYEKTVLDENRTRTADETVSVTVPYGRALAAMCSLRDSGLIWQGLTADTVSWGYEVPTADALYEALFSSDAIEWNRIGFFQDGSTYYTYHTYHTSAHFMLTILTILRNGLFQDVSMRLIANHVLKSGSGMSELQEEDALAGAHATSGTRTKRPR